MAYNLDTSKESGWPAHLDMCASLDMDRSEPAEQPRLPGKVQVILSAVAQQYGIKIPQIVGPSRSRTYASARREAAKRLYADGRSVDEIGRYLERDYDTVRNLIGKDFKRAEKVPELAEPIVEGYSSKDVSRLTGLTLRRLQWLDEQGIARASTVYPNRVYSWQDLATVRLVAELRRKAFSLQKIRLILKRYREESGVDTPRFLITDGSTVRVVRDYKEAIFFAVSMSGRVAVIDLSEGDRI